MNLDDIIKKVCELDCQIEAMQDGAVVNIMKSDNNALYFAGIAFASSVMSRKVLRLLHDLEEHIKQ